MNRYTKMYGWLYNTFGNTSFTIDEFRMNFPSPQPTKTIHDLIKLKFIKPIKRGKYKTIKPENFVKNIVKENINQGDVLKKTKRIYAFCNSTAVNIWTDGYYWTDFTKGFKPIHIQILKKDIPYWTGFFKNNDVEYIFPDEHKTLFGIIYVIHPANEIDKIMKHGSPIVSLKKVIEFCQKNRLLYRPALEYLDEKYNLKLYTHHEQVVS